MLRTRARTAEGPARELAAAPSTIPPFQRFLEENRIVVYRFLLAAAGPNEVDDCFQETFLAALRAYPRLRDGSNLRGWVLAIATRKAIDASRARARRPTPVANPSDGKGHHQEPVVPELGDRVWDDILALPPRQRVAVVHRVLLDRPYADLAGAMGCSEEAARANVYQGLKKLRERRRNREEH
jgi:RNA polymerase sigma factor (sigma-70 family)